MQKYDAAGALLVDVVDDAFSAQVDHADGSLWVGRNNGDFALYSTSGLLLAEYPRGFAVDTWPRIAFASDCSD